MKTILTTDWSPHIRSTVYAIATAAALAYTAGLLLGELVHRWNDRLAAMVSGRGADHIPGVTKMVVQLQAAQPVTITRRSECRRLRARGMTQQQIADRLGVSRTTVRRELGA